MPKKKRQSPSAKFEVGDQVRVKHGVKDIDYPDMPLGGWAGTVAKIVGADTLTVRWTDETMEAIHPVFKQRCEIDGLNAEEYVGEAKSQTGQRLPLLAPQLEIAKPQGRGREMPLREFTDPSSATRIDAVRMIDMQSAPAQNPPSNGAVSALLRNPRHGHSISTRVFAALRKRASLAAQYEK